ncbi:hypothetical protein [Amycolatopsis orientalis]|nr:hypothetical protein [Amycolatopsis orientalis]
MRSAAGGPVDPAAPTALSTAVAVLGFALVAAVALVALARPGEPET